MYKIKNLRFGSTNDFSLRINQKFKVKNFKLLSNIKIHDLIIKNQYKLKKILPNSNENIRLRDHNLKLNYDKNNLSINGKGKILIQNNDDFIEYEIKKKNEKYFFTTSLEIDENPISIELLNYKNKLESKVKLRVNGKYTSNNKEIMLKSISLTEDKNEFLVNELYLDANLKIKDLNDFKFSYNDTDNQKNELTLHKI